MSELDQLDYQIITMLNQDGRMPAALIARQLNANQRTIRKRIDKLVSMGAITIKAMVNPEFFNYTTSADIFLKIAPGHHQEVLAKLCQMQQVSYVAYGQGSEDISIEVRCKDNGELHDFVRDVLSKIPHLKVTRLVLVPRILRNIHQWLPKQDDFTPL